MDLDPQVVADPACHTGECPCWHPEHAALYWIDIPQGRLFRHRPDDGGYELCHEGDPLRAITIEADGAILLFEEPGTLLRWTKSAVTSVEMERPAIDVFRFNDVTADPAGRVFCGIMPEDHRPGALYRLDRDGTMNRVLDDVAFPNGMGFNPGADRFYFTDSYGNAIYTFDYDEDTGAITDRRLFADTEADPGVPDGLAVDADGHIWSGRWDGGGVIRYDPTGRRVGRFELPARKVTSLAFGGPAYRTAYLTTALASSSDPIGTKAEEGEGAGTLLRTDLGVTGSPPNRSRLDGV